MNNTSSLINKRILLGITGGIAAYKSAELLRLLKTAGADVRVVMTEGAKNFITSLTLQTLSGHKVYDALWDEALEDTMSHIELSRWADVVVIAPATANFMAKLAGGFADDLLTTLCIASTAPVVIAPAMNSQMWENPATKANLARLIERKFTILGPASGIQACGEIGAGRLLEPLELLHEIAHRFTIQLLAGKHVVITAGPTQEAIDPVRYLTNYSSGKMGYAIAEAAVAAGAKVTLISGPTALYCTPLIQKIAVKSTEQMLNAVLSQVNKADIFIAAAAVSDYRPLQIAEQKIKKQAQTWQLNLVRNPDILATVSQLKPRPFMVGFAAETENVIENAKQKLANKNLDMIVANRVGPDKGFQTDDNELTVISADHIHRLEFAPKVQLAKLLIQLIAAQLPGNN